VKARPSLPAAGNSFNDVYRFSPAANAWTALSPSGSGPSRRNSMGFAATPDGMLYVFGGYDGGTEGGSAGLIGLHGASCAGRSHAACTRCTAAALALSKHTSIYTNDMSMRSEILISTKMGYFANVDLMRFHKHTSLHIMAYPKPFQ
jgi:hypothetical protein